MSEHTYLSVTIDSLTALAETIETDLPGKTFRLCKSDGDLTAFFDATLTDPEVTTLDAAVADYSTSSEALTAARAKRCAEFEQRTQQLISGGFTHATKTFALSAEELAVIAGLSATRGEGGFSYPVTWNTIDNQDTHDLADAAAVLAFQVAAVDAHRVHMDSETGLKDQVRAAGTLAAIAAVTDSR